MKHFSTLVFSLSLTFCSAQVLFSGGQIRLDSVTPDGIYLANETLPHELDTVELDSFRFEWYIHRSTQEDHFFKQAGGASVHIEGVSISVNVERKAFIWYGGSIHPTIVSSNRLFVPGKEARYNYGLHLMANRRHTLFTDTDADTLTITYLSYAGRPAGGFFVNGQHVGFPNYRFGGAPLPRYDLVAPFGGFLVTEAQWIGFPVTYRKAIFIH